MAAATIIVTTSGRLYAFCDRDAKSQGLLGDPAVPDPVPDLSNWQQLRSPLSAGALICRL